MASTASGQPIRFGRAMGLTVMALEEFRSFRPRWPRHRTSAADGITGARRSVRPAPDAPARERARSVFHGLGARGLRSAEAGNLTAYLMGLAPVAGGWSIVEIEQLLLLRDLFRRGVVSS